MQSDGLPPLKMKCLADGLSLASINDKSKSMGEGSVLTFQMAATHDMGNQLANDAISVREIAITTTTVHLN